jgi:hypothetical protein
MTPPSKALLIVLLACGACGGDDGGGGADASNVPATITVSGMATKRENTSSSAAAGVMVSAFQTSDPNTAVANATTDAAGNYSMTITTNGKALDGYLKATLATFLDTYLYAPKPLDADFSGASINMINSGTLGLLSGTLCGNAQDAAKGVIAVLVVDAANNPVAGAMVSSTPAAAKYCYNSGGFPSRNATMTDTDGVAYMLNVAPGQVTVSATMTGTTFASHAVNARAGAFTTTVIEP